MRIILKWVLRNRTWCNLCDCFWGGVGADSCEQGSEHSSVTNVGDLLSGWAVVSWIVLSDNVVLPLTMLVKCLILRIKFPINNTCTIHVCLRLVEWQPEGSQSSSEVLPTRYSKQALKGLCFAHRIVSKSHYEHFMCFKRSISEFKAKWNASVLFLEIRHYEITDHSWRAQL